MTLNQLWENIKNFFDKGLWQNIVVSIGAFLLGYFTSWYKRNHFFVLYYLRRIKLFFFKKKYVLVWNDHSINVSEKIAAILKEKQPNYSYRSLNKADSLLAYPLFPSKIQMILLIVTDVTKLSEIEAKREQIQLKLLKYVRKGGMLFGTHDLIYRRCRNKALQDAFGCEICNFQRFSKPIQVTIVEEQRDHPLLTGLPDAFEIDDGEVCWGDWIRDAKVLVRTQSKISSNIGKVAMTVPILVVRHTGEIGTLIWINSADKNERLSRSLSEPQAHVTQIFENAIKYAEEIKTYYRLHT